MVVVVVVIVRSFARSFGVVSRSLERLCVCKVGSSVVELAVVYSSFASLFVCVWCRSSVRWLLFICGPAVGRGSREESPSAS